MYQTTYNLNSIISSANIYWAFFIYLIVFIYHYANHSEDNVLSLSSFWYGEKTYWSMYNWDIKTKKIS